jgi:hypothetical protein
VTGVPSCGVVLHVDGNDGASRQQVSEGHIVGHAGAHDLESEVEVDLLPGGHHTPSERFGREPSNFRAKRPNERWGLRVFDGMEKTLHVAQE